MNQRQRVLLASILVMLVSGYGAAYVGFFWQNVWYGPPTVVVLVVTAVLGFIAAVLSVGEGD